ncbi:sine oculis-binding protein homolog isoform X1 [Carassius auratus]|uniref:Sine oculis-binding protein homolog isoform X1 n=1 Tax=Carassius auratus TaxID=7957 RepID=A0A6P6K1U0_CARAU|nr:sine oculis-binding protein homolog isoform X1 [Carassius auratus]XP_026066119.1 sine oculis-binding protein homolog isoform X1 [Carassius auratus]
MPEMETERPAENKRSRKPAHPVRRDVRQEMKSFAESTMNELLGWYGYDSVDQQDSHKHTSVLKENSVPKPHSSSSSSSSEVLRSGEKASPVSPSSSSHSSSPRVKEQSMNVIVPLIKPSAAEDIQSEPIVCVWCQKEGMKRYSLLMGSELKSFCSEKCFAACRRAFFKHNKARDEDRHGDQSPPPGQTLDTPSRLLLKMNNNTRVCDWCKHMRHTKEYLDFGSGEERLQFCSNKCLNQYKMDVFYREARAALSSSGSSHKDEEDRPKTAVAENQKLLTPEAWDRPEKTLSPRSPPQQTPVSASQPRIQTRVSPSSPARPSHVTPEQPRPPQMPLPFVRPPLQGLRSPASHPPRPLSPIQRASFAPPPLLQPFPAPYMPFHPAYPPPLPPPWPQPMMLSPYPVFVPIPVPIPIPIPVFPQTGHTGVIRKLQEQEEERTPDPGHSEEPNSTVKTERCASPLTSERQVIQCLHKHPVKDETHTRESPTHKALYTSVVMPTASRIVTPASLYSLARSTAIQAASFSLDSSSPSPLSDGEDVKNSCLGGRDDGSTNHRSEKQMDCLIDQSKESQKEEEAPQDVEHTYARSIPPKLREKNTQTHLHTQTQTWENNTDLGSEASGRDDPEPAVKRRCLRIRDQIK